MTTKPILSKCWSTAGTSLGTPITGHRGGLERVISFFFGYPKSKKQMSTENHPTAVTFLEERALCCKAQCNGCGVTLSAADGKRQSCRRKAVRAVRHCFEGLQGLHALKTLYPSLEFHPGKTPSFHQGVPQLCSALLNFPTAWLVLPVSGVEARGQPQAQEAWVDSFNTWP